MAVIGGILMIAALAVGGFCLWAGSLQTAMATEVHMFNNVVAITPVTMFVLGAVSMLLLLLGIWLAFFATKRKYRSHRERRMLEKREKEQAAELAETRAKLQQREGPGAGQAAPGTSGRPTPPPTPPASSTRATSPAPSTSSTPPTQSIPARESGSSAVAGDRGHGAASAPAPAPREDHPGAGPR